MGQLGNRVQHALRAFTPRDQKAVKVAAETFRPNKKFDVAQAITELGVGEALLSFLDPKGVPTPVERCLIAPPQGRIGPVKDAERAAVMSASALAGKYDKAIDRASAYEKLTGRVVATAPAEPAAPVGGAPKRRGQYGSVPPTVPTTSGPWGTRPPSSPPVESPAPQPAPRPEPRLKKAQPPAPAPEPKPRAPVGRPRDSIGVTVAKAAGRSMATVAAREAAKAVFGKGKAASIGATVGGAVLRGVLGSILR